MSERELTPDEEAEISRLLADAASPEGIPEAVSARLDDVLAGLVAEREAEAPVVPLRSRRWPQVLVAAAAVSLVGFVGANFVEQQSGGADMSASSEAAGGDDALERPQDVTGQPPHSGAKNGVKQPAAPLPEAAADSFLRSSLASLRDLGDFAVGSSEAFDRYAYAAKCGRPALRDAAAYEVSLKGAGRAVVTVQRVGRNAATVNVYPCGQSIVPVSSRLVLGIE